MAGAYERLNVPTRYGITHIIASGSRDAPPLVLLHAMGVTATMWLPNIAAISREYRTYAVDTLGDQGKSTLYQRDLYPRNGQERSEWLVDVFKATGLRAQSAGAGASAAGRELSPVGDTPLGSDLETGASGDAHPFASVGHPCPTATTAGKSPRAGQGLSS